MKNLILSVLALATVVTMQAQQPGKHVYIPGEGRLDVEQFIKPIDTSMDISRLSLAELRVLREQAAAEGKPEEAAQMLFALPQNKSVQALAQEYAYQAGQTALSAALSTCSSLSPG